MTVFPFFPAGSSFSVQENSLNVGTVTASDGDVQDSVVGYRVSGGLDSALFSITNGGVLSFRSAPDYENPADNGGNNVYVLVVEVTSGVGGRVRTATQSISVTVVDVDEVPSTPSAPVLSSPTSTSLLVSWSAPGGTGPSIIDYDVGYGLNSGGPFTDWPHSDASRSATITGLNASTLYYVRVLARNAEGDSSWSETSSFTTGSTQPPPLLTNASKLVSNLNQTLHNVHPSSDNYNRAHAQKFSAGSTSILEKIVMPVYSFTGSPNVSVSLHHVGSDSNPGDKLYDLTGNVNSTGTWNFTAPANALLNASEYFLVVRKQGGNGSFWVTSTSSSAEDSGAASGWSIGNDLYATHDGGSSWLILGGSNRYNLRFAVYGEVRGTVVNYPPVFSSSSSFFVNENLLSVGVVVASDVDGEDSVSGYSVSGGVDSALFSITDDGVLSFVSAPDFESPVDVGGNNVYDLVVTVTSGTGSRVRTATQSIVVTVRDVDEAPLRPSAPVLSSSTSTSLSVGWSAPSNTGPAISDYDLGYGLNSNGPFTDWPHSDASRSATITGLNASTLYYVRVRAGNAEGDSSWSEPASFTTGSAVTNSDPVFASSSSFSVNENLLSVGTVVASDVDGEDSVTDYSVSGGVDSARFSITSAGVLTFNSAPDFESPADSGGNNVYDIVVTATSGTSGRVRTATQSVMVTVVDVVEVPSNVTSVVRFRGILVTCLRRVIMILGVFGLVVVLCMWWILMIIGFMLIMCPLRILF